MQPHKKSYRNILFPWVSTLDRTRKLLAINWLVEFWRLDLSLWFVLQDPKPYMKSHRWSNLFLSLAHEALERKCWCTVFARRLERICLTWQLLISRENTPGRRGYRWCYTWCSRYNHLILASSVSVSKYCNKTRKSDRNMCSSACFHCKGVNLLFFIFFLLSCWIDTNRHCVVSVFVLRTGVWGRVGRGGSGLEHLCSCS